MTPTVAIEKLRAEWPATDTLTQRALHFVNLSIAANTTNLQMAQLAGNDGWTADAHRILAKRRPLRRRLQERLDNAHNPDCPGCRFPMSFEPATSDGSGQQYPASYGCERGCGVTLAADLNEDAPDARQLPREIYDVEPAFLEGDGPMVATEGER